MNDRPGSEFQGVGETPDHLKFDEAALDVYMRKRVEGYAGPISVSKFKGGQSNPP